MKTLILATILQVIYIQGKSQEIKLPELFKKIDVATQHITSGQFKLNSLYTKVSVGEDSSKRLNLADFYFKSNPSDTLIGYKISSSANSGLHQLYNGNELLVLTSWNKRLEIAPIADNNDRIRRIKDSGGIFPLFMLINSDFQLAAKKGKTASWTLKEEKVNYKGQSCYKINGPPYIGETVKNYLTYYVSANDFIPVGREVIIEKNIANAREIQTFEDWISDFKPNKTISDQQFDRKALSTYDKEVIVSEKNQPVANSKLLKKGSQSPDWELPLISGQTLKLSELKNKIVILDFWYKACAPCQKQMIDLQQLHDKFDRQKVVFVGVNTKDDPIKDKLTLFLKNRALTMTSVYNGHQIEKLYNVYGSPALFIIDGTGKIAFSQDGYSDTLIKDVSDQIEKLL